MVSWNFVDSMKIIGQLTRTFQFKELIGISKDVAHLKSHLILMDCYVFNSEINDTEKLSMIFRIFQQNERKLDKCKPQ